MRFALSSIVALTFGVLGWSFGHATESVDFARDVLPTFQRACFECHGADRAEADLRLDSRDTAFRDPRIIAKKDSKASELVRRISLPEGHEEAMPSRGKRLAQEDIRKIEAWIDAGASWPDDARLATHWAYVAPIRPVVPDVHGTGFDVRTAVDAFVFARLQQEGWRPAPEASREQLARRLYLDLIGLPPSPDELDAFVHAEAPDAYERLVDELLASDQFGVRWARPWLDYARYADSHGFQRDDLRDLWPYRDWVVSALNADMPFDQFTIEQLAGDLLPDSSESQRTATGFNRSAPTNVEAGTDPEETRVNQIHDRVNTLGMVWLGTTLECAQCHDHKYDPFTQEDYYGLFAFFNRTSLEADRTNPQVPGSIQFKGPVLELADSDRERLRAEAETNLKLVRQQIASLLTELNPQTPDDEDESATKPKGARGKAAAQRKRKQAAEEDTILKSDPRGTELLAERTRLETEVKQLAPTTTLVMQEDTPRSTTIFRRGDFRTPGAEVKSHTPRTLPPLDSASSGEPTRLDLARWLIRRDNPLVARVTVNRWWAELFGQGLVGTPEDFGIKGDGPTHPELLDWLACDFMDNGWSLKRTLKTIVLSSTYRQSSQVTDEHRARDDQNRLYARGPRYRLEAERIRDNALAIAGLLERRRNGPPIRPYQPDGLWVKVGGQRYPYEVSSGGDQYRRGLYVVWKRSAPYPSFVNFDASSRVACRVKRPRSNTPLQALTLINDPVYVEAAMAFARRILDDLPAASDEERLGYAFRRATCRTPRPDELEILSRLLASERAARAEDAESASSFVGPFRLPAEISPQEFCAWYAVAAALLNLDETISQG